MNCNLKNMNIIIIALKKIYNVFAYLNDESLNQPSCLCRSGLLHLHWDIGRDRVPRGSGELGNNLSTHAPMFIIFTCIVKFLKHAEQNRNKLLLCHINIITDVPFSYKLLSSL